MAFQGSTFAMLLTVGAFVVFACFIAVNERRSRSPNVWLLERTNSAQMLSQNPYSAYYNAARVLGSDATYDEPLDVEPIDLYPFSDPESQTFYADNIRNDEIAEEQELRQISGDSRTALVELPNRQEYAPQRLHSRQSALRTMQLEQAAEDSGIPRDYVWKAGYKWMGEGYDEPVGYPGSIQIWHRGFDNLTDWATLGLHYAEEADPAPHDIPVDSVAQFD